MEISLALCGEVFAAYLASSDLTFGAYAYEVFYKYYDGAISRSVIERTRGALALELVQDFVWAGLVSLLD